jgi:hypothetical protein
MDTTLDIYLLFHFLGPDTSEYLQGRYECINENRRRLYRDDRVGLASSRS